jgi:hypothetical protein
MLGQHAEGSSNRLYRPNGAGFGGASAGRNLNVLAAGDLSNATDANRLTGRYL